MKRKNWFGRLLGVFATVALAGAPAVLSQSTAQGGGTAKGPGSAQFPPELLKPAALAAKAPDVYEVKFVTTKGEFTVKVTRAWAPQGADRFYNLVQNRFFDGASFFRVVTEPRPFVVQFGLSPFPAVSEVWRQAPIPDDPVKQTNQKGYVTYAMAGKNTRTTQLFINLGDNSRLDGMGFAPFGQVTQGMDVVEKLYSGYGEGAPSGNGPDQGLIQTQGRAYLEKSFPKLDSIQAARVLAPGAPPPAPVKKP